MNKVIKILLSIVIISLSALVVPLKGHSENIKTESVAVQAAVKSTEMSLENFVIEQPVSINFEFYLMCLRVIFITSLFKM